MKKIPWFEILLIIAVMSVSLYAALSDAQNLSWRWFTRDDAYYYFKVAQNISEGHGSTFDGINQTNGYHPLWLWICTPIFALARFDLILPLRILLLTMSGLSVATAIILYRLIGKIFTPAIGAIAAIYWVFSIDVLKNVYQAGLETGIAAFFIVLLIYKLFEYENKWRTDPVTRKQLISLSILAIFVSFSRLDLIFFAGMAGIWIVFRKHPLRYFLPPDIVAVVISVLLGFIFRIPFKQYLGFSDAAVAMIATALILKLPAAFLFGLYQHPSSIERKKMAKSLVLFSASTSILTGLVMMIISPLAHYQGFPRMVIIYDFIFTTILFGITRYAALGLRPHVVNKADEQSPTKQLSKNWKTWLNDGLVYYGILGGTMSVYMLWNKIVFGTASPVSGQIKRWWGSLSGNIYGGSAPNTLSFFGIDYSGEANAWHPVSSVLGRWAENIQGSFIDYQFYLMIILAFAIIFYLILLINRQEAVSAIIHLGIIPLFFGSWIQVLSYHITGYSAYKEWYWISQLVTQVLAISLIAGMLYQKIRKYAASRTLLWVVAAGIFVGMGSSYWTFVQNKMPYNHWAVNDPYNHLSAFLEEHTELSSIIGITGGGSAGYFIKDRTVINLDGLINSNDYFNLLKNNSAGEYLDEIGMDYILSNPTLLDQLPYNGQFDDYLIFLSDASYGGKELIHFQSNQP